MRLSKDLSKTLVSVCRPLIEDLKLELVDIDCKRENGRTILEVVIDKEGGVTVDDCALVSRKISLILDIEDVIPFKYYLEVGSPGVFRKLRTGKEFERYTGSRVKAMTRLPVEGETQFIGILRRFGEGKVVLANGEQSVELELDGIKEIHLFPDI
jgi:ribosome maturation factor RimP